jgi:hypothetical protein
MAVASGDPTKGCFQIGSLQKTLDRARAADRRVWVDEGGNIHDDHASDRLDLHDDQRPRDHDFHPNDNRSIHHSNDHPYIPTRTRNHPGHGTCNHPGHGTCNHPGHHPGNHARNRPRERAYRPVQRRDLQLLGEPFRHLLPSRRRSRVVQVARAPMFEKHKTERAAKEHQAAFTRWESEDETLKGALYLVLHGGGPEGGGPSDVPLILKKDERAVLQCIGAGLFEPVRAPGHYQGGNQGISIPIGSTGARYRVGRSRGTFVQGDESPNITDIGTVVITTRRVVFVGAKRTVEWAFSKLIAIQHYQHQPWTALPVSNRAKVTGFVYDDAHERNVRLSLEAAVALFNNDTAELEAQLREAIDANTADRPEVAQLPASG